jgi:hypothetical protein
VIEPVVEWPLSHEQRELVVFLGELIRRAGVERFTSARLVRADERDFPGAWKPTRFAVHALLYRLFWHAHLDADVEVEDHRPGTAPTHEMLETSVIELVAAADGRATFQIEAIGNDDVAGLLAHQVGAAYLDLLPPDPFREARRKATPAEASAAAVYLGLGVLVANSSMYPRRASRLVGEQVYSEQLVATAGGLSIEQATLLVAVQDLVRDDVQDALSTLHPPQAEWVERWRDVLEAHEDELRAMLELDGREPMPLARPPEPRVPERGAEPDLRRFNRGRTTFRVRRYRSGRGLLGMTLGAAGFALPFGLIAGPALMVAGGLVGLRFATFEFECADPGCRARMAGELPTCPGCGGTIAETIAHAGMRLERLEELEAGDAHSPSDESEQGASSRDGGSDRLH